MNSPRDIDPGLESRIEQADQSAALRFWDEITSPQRENLTGQLAAIDFSQLATLVGNKSTEDDHRDRAQRADPPPAFRIDDAENRFSASQAREAGGSAIADGKIGMILVAGGQGTRLGFDRPKGMYSIGPVSKRSLFEVIIDHLRARAAHHGTTIPLYLMTSPATHDETIEFLESRDRFGLSSEDLMYFCQGTMPAVDLKTGELLLSAKDSLAVSPDGHGGMLAALDQSGCLADAEKRGIEHLFYAQIDNPLVNICDPELIGYHRMCRSEMTTQVVRKSDPLEKVGNVVEIDGKVQIIEYSDLPVEIASRLDDRNRPRLWAGNIAVHVFDTAFLRRMAQDASALPFHRANKKVAYIDDSGRTVEPDEPNACKFERFIFDLLPNAENSIAVEASKAKAFAPVKNADGEPTDTPTHARQAMIALHREWLIECGIDVPDGVAVEIDPKFAIDAEQLRSKRERIRPITGSMYLTD